jgi:hypothetical protein
VVVLFLVVSGVSCDDVLLLECGEVSFVVVVAEVFISVKGEVEVFVLVGGVGLFCVGVSSLFLVFDESEAGASGELFV